MSENEKMDMELNDEALEQAAGGLPPRASVPRGGREAEQPAGNEAVAPWLPIYGMSQGGKP